MEQKHKKSTQTEKPNNFYRFSKNCEDAMFVNPVASANECTGYTLNAPLSDEESEDVSRMLNTPTTKYNLKKNKN